MFRSWQRYKTPLYIEWLCSRTQLGNKTRGRRPLIVYFHTQYLVQDVRVVSVLSVSKIVLSTSYLDDLTIKSGSLSSLLDFITPLTESYTTHNNTPLLLSSNNCFPLVISIPPGFDCIFNIEISCAIRELWSSPWFWRFWCLHRNTLPVISSSRDGCHVPFLLWHLALYDQLSCCTMYHFQTVSFGLVRTGCPFQLFQRCSAAFNIFFNFYITFT